MSGHFVQLFNMIWVFLSLIFELCISFLTMHRKTSVKSYIMHNDVKTIHLPACQSFSACYLYFMELHH